jgi:photosystem II stability/assembly factor-like uncharacterized protein
MSHKSTLFIIYLLIFYSFETAQCQWYPETCDVDGGMYSISMWNNTTGWIGGENGICKYDGNGHWDLINTLSSMHDLVFTDSLNGWAEDLGIYKTNDGGYNWIKVFDNEFLLNTMDISAVDSLHCWAINCYEDYYGNTVYILEFTDDGGITWKAPQNYFQGYLVFFKDLNHGWCLREHITFLTNDGGNNWQTYYDTISSGDFYSIYDFYFIDTSRGWKIGGFPGHKNAFISSTIDGGKNWSIQYQGNATDWYDGIYFPDSLYGYVAGYRGDGDSVLILKTKDGGLTWEEQIYLAINAGLSRNIFFTDSITGWIVGRWQYDPLILHTENSGIGTGDIGDELKIFNRDLTLKACPNPCTNQTELSIGTDSERTLTLNLFSFNGEKTTIFNGINFSAGKHPYILNTEMISSGIYLLTIFGEGISANSKLVVLK